MGTEVIIFRSLTMFCRRSQVAGQLFRLQGVTFFYSKIVSIQHAFVFGMGRFFLLKKRNQTAYNLFIMGTVPNCKGGNVIKRRRCERKFFY